LTEQKTSEIEAVNQKIEAINKQIITLKEQLSKTHEEVNSHIEKRDQLNKNAQVLRQEIVEIKKERDQLNESVKELKIKRDEIRRQMDPFVEQIREHSQKIVEIKEKHPSGNRHQLQKAFDALEFKIATSSLDLKEEKRLIDQVKEIEIQLSSFKKMDQHRKKINEIKAELKIFQEKADAFHKELTAHAQKSQELHSKMLSKFQEVKKIRDEATALHVLFLQAKARIKPLHEEIGRCVEQRQKLFGARNEQFEERKKQFEASRVETEKQKRAKEQEIKEKIGSQAREKLERGEQLDWREFQLLAGDDSETED
jgi:uncharacterized coiled-coil DUF342 family protein